MRYLFPFLFLIAACGSERPAVIEQQAECPTFACPEPAVALEPELEAVDCPGGDHCVQRRGSRYCATHCP